MQKVLIGHRHKNSIAFSGSAAVFSHGDLGDYTVLERKDISNEVTHPFF